MLVFVTNLDVPYTIYGIVMIVRTTSFIYMTFKFRHINMSIAVRINECLSPKSRFYFFSF